jgi:hypothetical protein
MMTTVLFQLIPDSCPRAWPAATQASHAQNKVALCNVASLPHMKALVNCCQGSGENPTAADQQPPVGIANTKMSLWHRLTVISKLSSLRCSLPKKPRLRQSAAPPGRQQL